MRTILETVQVGGSWLLGMLGTGTIWAIGREGRRAHSVDASPVGPVGSSGGLGAAGGSRVWGSAGQAVDGGLSAPGGHRHRAGGRRWSLGALVWRGQRRRVTDVQYSAPSLVWKMRRDALRMLRDVASIDTMATRAWAEGVLA